MIKLGETIRRDCANCNKTIYVTPLKKKYYKGKNKGWVFKEVETGKVNRTSNICYECILIRNRPVRSLEFQKGRQAERIVEKFFLEEGFEVAITKNNGPDLVVKTRESEFKVEVKSVTFDRGSYFVSRVCNKRTSDDYIAIVLDENRIIFSKMGDHLAKCAPSGSRRMTEFF